MFRAGRKKALISSECDPKIKQHLFEKYPDANSDKPD